MNHISDFGPPSHSARQPSSVTPTPAIDRTVRVTVKETTPHAKTSSSGLHDVAGSPTPTTPFERTLHFSPTVQVIPNRTATQAKPPSKPLLRRQTGYLLFQLLSLIPAIVGMAFLACALSDLPRVYKRTWWFHKVDQGKWGSIVLTDPRIGNLPLYYSLVVLLILLIVSFAWNLFDVTTRCTSHRRSGSHPGVQIAANLIFLFLFLPIAIFGITNANSDMNPDNEHSDFWLSNVQRIQYAGPRLHDGRPLSAASGALPMSWRWQGDPPLSRRKSRLQLVRVGCIFAFILTALHLLLFLAASRGLNLRRKEHRQEVYDRIAGKGDDVQDTNAPTR